MTWKDPPDKGDWLLGTICFVILFVGAYMVANWLGAFQIKHKPTADQLFGCSYAQTDTASGECK